MKAYKICPYCGAHLDPGESCDCAQSMYQLLTPEEQRTVDALIEELLLSQRFESVNVGRVSA